MSDRDSLQDGPLQALGQVYAVLELAIVTRGQRIAGLPAFSHSKSSLSHHSLASRTSTFLLQKACGSQKEHGYHERFISAVATKCRAANLDSSQSTPLEGGALCPCGENQGDAFRHLCSNLMSSSSAPEVVGLVFRRRHIPRPHSRRRLQQRRDRVHDIRRVQLRARAILQPEAPASYRAL